MENSFKSQIEGAKSVLVVIPQNPTFDEVAAGLSVYLSLKETKETAITAQSPMIVEFNRLVGVNKISPEVGNKNLIIKFSNYKASDIERVSYDIENGEFKLTVIPKPGLVSPQKDQLALSYSGISADLVVLIGGESEADFAALASKDLAEAKTLHIGTHAFGGQTQRNLLSFARPASSVSEVVASLLSQSGFNFDVDVSTNLLAGIEEGSHYFKGSDVSAETFEIFANLIRNGGQRTGSVPMPSMAPQQTQFPAMGFGQQPFQPTQPSPSIASAAEDTVEEDQEAPKDWLEPKIFKGTSTS